MDKGQLIYEGNEYLWTRAKNDASGGSKTTITPREILRVSQQLVNNSAIDRMWPLLSYQSASRHWVAARSDANRKLRTQLHDRRCGYLGSMDRAVNMKSIYEWCAQMEWMILKGQH